MTVSAAGFFQQAEASATLCTAEPFEVALGE
jgi:hypothetical protein